MKKYQLFFVLLTTILLSSSNSIAQDRQYDTLPVFRKNTKVEFPKYIFSKINKSKYKILRPYFFEIKTDEKGKVVEASLKNGEDNEYSKEVLKAIRKMPKWAPAQKNGKNVAATFIAPLVFQTDK